jgi:hypothetical protein
MEIILTSKPDEEKPNSVYLEYPKHDGEKWFDHHGSYNSNEPVCKLVPFNLNPETIYISHWQHMDETAAIARLLGKTVYDDFLDEIATFDSKGPEALPDSHEKGRTARMHSAALAYFLKDKNLRPTESQRDVTDLMLEFIKLPEKIVREMAEKMNSEREKATKESIKRIDKEAGIVLCSSAYFPDSLYFYEKNISTVVYYNEKTKTISIFGSNLNKNVLNNYNDRKWAEIDFKGHPRACGSNPREIERTLEQAEDVYEEIRNELIKLNENLNRILELAGIL